MVWIFGKAGNPSFLRRRSQDSHFRLRPTPGIAGSSRVMAAQQLLPPFPKDKSILAPAGVIHPAAIAHHHQPLRPRVETREFLKTDLETPRLDLIYRNLWLAGLPRPSRPLHRQKLLGRTIFLTESPDEHLVWHESRLFLKPLPDYLLEFDYWQKNLCDDRNLHRSACGLLLSYAWLICHRSDLRIANEAGLLPKQIEWSEWTSFMDHFLRKIDLHTLEQVDRRYHYGELRLSRLNSLYRWTPSVFSTQNLVYGYMSSSTWYKAFFERNFAWLLAVFAYISVVLSAMQVGLSGTKLEENPQFLNVSYGFTIASIVAVAASIVLIFLVWAGLLLFHFCSTVRFTTRAQREREKRLMAHGEHTA